MSADPRKFAQRVLARFEEMGRYTDEQVKAAYGPSKSTMNKLRKVAAGTEQMNEPREPTWTHIDLASNWAPGSSRRVWRGQEPVPQAAVVGGQVQDPDSYVESSTGRLVQSEVTNEDLLREILRSRAESDQIRAEVDELSKRVARLEQ